MADPTEVFYSLGLHAWGILTQIGGVSVIWIIGIFLCVYRRDLPSTPRKLIGASLGIQLFVLLASTTIVPLLSTIMMQNGRGLDDWRWVYMTISYASRALQMLAEGLLLYGIFGRFQRRPDWDAVAVETPEG